MKRALPIILLLSGAASHAGAASTIDSSERYSWGANIGWMDWRIGGGTYGAAVNRQFISGHAYAANIGWIDLGDGTPANGSSYANNSAADFGVNCSSAGADLNLSGYAYSANAGWISFNAAGANRPRIDKATGTFHGFAWGANIGWIPLEQAGFKVATDRSLIADPTATPSPTPTPTPSPTSTSTPTPTVSPTPTPAGFSPEEIAQMLIGRVATRPEADANGDGKVDSGDVRSVAAP